MLIEHNHDVVNYLHLLDSYLFHNGLTIVLQYRNCLGLLAASLGFGLNAVIAMFGFMKLVNLKYFNSQKENEKELLDSVF
jgi:hypothetical protein